VQDRHFPTSIAGCSACTTGCSFAAARVFGTSDFIDGSELERKARAFIDETAGWGRSEITGSLPLANLGQPNDWLLHSADGGSLCG